MSRRRGPSGPRARLDELEAILAGPGRVSLGDLYGAAGDFADASDPEWDAALDEWCALTGASRAAAELAWPYPFADD